MGNIHAGRRRTFQIIFSSASLACLTSICSAVNVTYPSAPQIADKNAPGQIAVTLQDYATAPNTSGGANSQTGPQIARINFMRQDPTNTNRYVVNDLNGNLYTLNKTTKQFSSYINFRTTFSSFDSDPGYAAGLVTVQFDPGFLDPTSPGFGMFYTTHTEDISGGSAYRLGVLTQWRVPGNTAGDISNNFGNSAQQPTHRTMLTVQYTGNAHPIGDIAFNPNAGPADPDYRMMYISSGDGTAGESTDNTTRQQDQMLNNMLGKVMRIQPNAITAPTAYSVPSDNPFTNQTTYPGALGEIYAYGFRNPHRLNFDAASGKLIVDDIGLHSYEEVDIVHKGANYGYSTLEGNQVLGNPSNTVNSNSLPTSLNIYSNNTTTPRGTITPTYPVAEYSHRDGDAIAGGFVYHGTLIPALVGKYVFADITTGRLFYCDYSDMLAQDAENGGNGDPLTMPSLHELNVMYNGQPIRVFDLVHSTYDLRNDGVIDGDPLPGAADATSVNDPYGVAYGGGRADIRLAVGSDNEIYLISKSDGMIRELVPEPGSLALLGAGMIFLTTRRRAR